MLYYVCLASSTPVRAALGFFLSLGGRLLVDYIRVRGA